MTYAVLVYPTAITGVSLNGINDAVFDFLDNAGVVGLSILRTRRTLVVPIKENNHSGDRLGRTVDPLSSIFEPLDAVHAARIFRHNPSVDIAALISARCKSDRGDSRGCCPLRRFLPPTRWQRQGFPCRSTLRRCFPACRSLLPCIRPAFAKWELCGKSGWDACRQYRSSGQAAGGVGRHPQKRQCRAPHD